MEKYIYSFLHRNFKARYVRPINSRRFSKGVIIDSAFTEEGRGNDIILLTEKRSLKGKIASVLYKVFSIEGEYLNSIVDDFIHNEIIHLQH